MKASIRVVARSRKARVLVEMLKIIYGGSARNERKNDVDCFCLRPQHCRLYRLMRIAASFDRVARNNSSSQHGNAIPWFLVRIREEDRECVNLLSFDDTVENLILLFLLICDYV
jgi:hypothetical protein